MDIKLQPNITGTNVNLVKGATQADLTNAVNNAKTYRDEAQAFSIVSEAKSVEASYSALNASISSTTASDKATIATNKATEANNSAINASASEAVCIAKATIATDKADIATAQSVIATNKANEASISANTATTQAGIATTKASEASTSASNALTSENNADTSEANALIYRNQAESFANSINPSDLVHISGTETITGNKTFSGTVSGLTKATVGLNNVDNTSDANKPISTATQTALNTKVDKVTSTDNAITRFDGTTGLVQNSVVTISDTGTISFPTGARITGDFSNGSWANRLSIQNSTSNTVTSVHVLPNGTATATSLRVFNSSNPDNSSFNEFTCTDTYSSIVSGARGTGTALPLFINVAGAERMRIDTNGNVLLGNTSDNSTRRLGFTTAGGGSSAIESVTIGVTNQELVFKTTYVTESEKMRLTGLGSLLLTSGTGTLGYGTGAGGTVTQLTSKSTAVTLNKPSGQITMSNAALAAGASVLFAFYNSTCDYNYDQLIVNMHGVVSGHNNYKVENAGTIGGGGISIRLTNISGISLSESPSIKFTVIKGAIV